MSRGFGHIQRFLLCELDEQCGSDARWLQAWTLARRLEGCEPSDGTVRTVRRALRLLRDAGLIELASTGIADDLVADLEPAGARRARLLARVPPSLQIDAAVRRARRRRTHRVAVPAG